MVCKQPSSFLYLKSGDRGEGLEQKLKWIVLMNDGLNGVASIAFLRSFFLSWTISGNLRFLLSPEEHLVDQQQDSNIHRLNKMKNFSHLSKTTKPVQPTDFFQTQDPNCPLFAPCFGVEHGHSLTSFSLLYAPCLFFPLSMCLLSAIPYDLRRR